MKMTTDNQQPKIKIKAMFRGKPEWHATRNGGYSPGNTRGNSPFLDPASMVFWILTYDSFLHIVKLSGSEFLVARAKYEESDTSVINRVTSPPS